jgi:DNA replication and repair protein RecF
MFAEIMDLLHLEQISLTRFKNYSDKQFSFSGRIVGLCGPNGAGKTNLLDAIYYLCLTKSYFAKADAASSTFGFQGFRIEGRFIRQNEVYKTVCILRENGKKEIQLNQENYSRFSQHIGKFPVVFVAPDDVFLVTGGSEERRKFIDTIISQLDSEYLHQLIQYNRILQQRNGLLRQLSETGKTEDALISVLDRQLVSPGEFIFSQRSSFLHSFIPEVKLMYTMIAGETESLELNYQSPLFQHDFVELLVANRERDIYAQRTTSGIHKDELDITLGEHSLKQIASQGQRKSLLFALKLAEFSVLRRFKGFPPILLLDDVFEKLDEKRMHNLLQWACVDNTGQVFLTDTHCNRLREALEKLSVSYQVEEL